MKKNNPVVWVLAVALALISVFVFSPGLAVAKFLHNSSLTVNLLVYAVYAVIVILSLAFIVYLINKKPQETKLSDLDTRDEFVAAFTKFLDGPDYLKDDVEKLHRQVFVFDEKVTTLTALLSQKFEGAAASFSRFNTTVRNTQKVVFSNFRNAISIVSSFDSLDYQRFVRAKSEYPEDFVRQKLETFESYKKELKGIILRNEDIFLMLDKLQLELSKASADNGEVSPVLEEMNGLIAQAKLYKS